MTATTDAPLLQVQHLFYIYPDGQRALDGLSLEIRDGERVALLGPNGAGKSTFLLHLNGILGPPRSGQGSIAIAGIPVVRERLREIRGVVGLVFQNPDDQLFCPTLEEDLAFGPRNFGVPEPEIAERISHILAAVGLHGMAERSPFHLSFGQKKRAALATVLVLRPRLLVLDEPTSNLDPRGRRDITTLLRQAGGTQLIATHHLEFAREHCTRAIILDAGRVVADGPPETLLADQKILQAHGLV